MNKMRIKVFSIFLFLIPVSICNNDFVKETSFNQDIADFTIDPITDNELEDERTLIKNYWDDELPGMFKRTPSSSFFGMRGRKRQDRAPSGFLGVRGKKNDNYIESEPEYSDENVNVDDYLDEYLASQVNKRKPQGFVGLRGKKSETPEFIQKRVPVTGFFGMRGKKEPLSYQSSGYIGVRKKPSLPFMKFVGVRGKKAVKRDTRHLRLQDSNDDMFEGFRTIQRRANTPPDKSIGFIGMRG